MFNLVFLFLLTIIEKTSIKQGLKLRASNDVPKEVLPSLNEAVNTILFKKGANLTEVNSISDAIIHCRGCSGADIPAGSGLYEEMSYFDSYKELFDTETGTIALNLKKSLETASQNSDEGNLTGSGSQVINCLTLGHYVPKYSYNIPFKCTVSGSVRTCTAEGDASFSGRDFWDFESLESNTAFQNLITEKIPELLVNLKGPSVPFGIPFANTVHYKIERSDQIPIESPVETPEPTKEDEVKQTPEQSEIQATPEETQIQATPEETGIPATPEETKILATPEETEILATPDSTDEVLQTPEQTNPGEVIVTPEQTVYVPTKIPDPTAQTDETQTNNNSSDNGGGKKKNNATVIAVVVVVLVVVVAGATVFGVWFFKRRKFNQTRVADLLDQIADQSAMDMALIP